MPTLECVTRESKTVVNCAPGCCSPVNECDPDGCNPNSWPNSYYTYGADGYVATMNNGVLASE